MILTKRQFDIFKYLIENEGTYLSSSRLSEVFKLSSRTIKSDFADIRIFSDTFNSFEFLSNPGQGVTIKIVNHQAFVEDMIDITNIELPLSSLSDNDITILMLKMIINNREYLSKDKIINRFHISESYFYKIYNMIKTQIKPFDLELLNSKDRGYYISGNENDLRNLIAKKELIDKHHMSGSYEEREITSIYEYIADLFNDNEYKVTDSFLQNLSFHILLMIERTKFGHFVPEVEDKNFETEKFYESKEYRIASTICNRYIIKNNNDQKIVHESYMLAHTILGKTNYFYDEDLQKEINTFVYDSLKEIKDKFKINLTNNEKLKLYLVLHIVPLIYRIKSKSELKNLMATEIEQKFPFANDIALYFSILFSDHFNMKISREELTYITLYINYGIEDLNLSKTSKNILVITDLRASETVLIRHKLLSWFSDKIIDITFANPYEEIQDFEAYDAVLATDIYDEKYRNALTIINLFPNEVDFNKISLALNGFTSEQSIIDKFSENRFFIGKETNKKDVLKRLCDMSVNDIDDLDNTFFDKIWSRESIASTYFGNLVALPHPLAPVSNETFVSVGVLEKAIDWDGKKVQLVLLISIEQNNPRAFQFWYYLSDIIRDTSLIQDLSNSKDYQSFITTFEKSLSTLEF